MSDQDFAEAVELATELAEERSLHQQTMAERDRLRDRVFELRIYEGFGQDHGHQRCVAEIARLRALLEPSVTMTSPHVTDPGNDESVPPEEDAS